MNRLYLLIMLVLIYYYNRTNVVLSKVTDWSLVNSVAMGLNISAIFLLEVLDDQ